jgi:hypothetical protein
MSQLWHGVVNRTFTSRKGVNKRDFDQHETNKSCPTFSGSYESERFVLLSSLTYPQRENLD